MSTIFTASVRDAKQNVKKGASRPSVNDKVANAASMEQPKAILFSCAELLEQKRLRDAKREAFEIFCNAKAAERKAANAKARETKRSGKNARRANAEDVAKVWANLQKLSQNFTYVWGTPKAEADKDATEEEKRKFAEAYAKRLRTAKAKRTLKNSNANEIVWLCDAPKAWKNAEDILKAANAAERLQTAIEREAKAAAKIAAEEAAKAAEARRKAEEEARRKAEISEAAKAAAEAAKKEAEAESAKRIAELEKRIAELEAAKASKPRAKKSASK